MAPMSAGVLKAGDSGCPNITAAVENAAAARPLRSTCPPSRPPPPTCWLSMLLMAPRCRSHSRCSGGGSGGGGNVAAATAVVAATASAMLPRSTIGALLHALTPSEERGAEAPARWKRTPSSPPPLTPGRIGRVARLVVVCVLLVLASVSASVTLLLRLTMRSSSVVTAAPLPLFFVHAVEYPAAAAYETQAYTSGMCVVGGGVSLAASTPTLQLNETMCPYAPLWLLLTGLGPEMADDTEDAAADAGPTATDASNIWGPATLGSSVPAFASLTRLDKVLEGPRNAFTTYYQEVARDNYFYYMLPGCTINVTVSAATVPSYPFTTFASYVRAFLLDKARVLQSTSSDVAVQLRYPNISLGTTFLFWNQPRLHRLFNAPALMSMLRQGAEEEAVVAATAADVASTPLAEPPQRQQQKPPWKGSTAATPLDAAAPPSLSAPLYPACAAHMPAPADLTPASGIDGVVTTAYMQLASSVVLKLFSFDVWWQLTGSPVAPTIITAKSATFSTYFSSDHQAQRTGTAAGHQGSYNLVVDPAKVCTAPALYTVSLNPLLAQASAWSLGSAAGWFQSSINLTHRYPAARVVAVVAQCSGVPLSFSVTMSFANPGRYPGSGQYYYTSVVYFIFLFCYLALLLSFLLMIVPCRRQRPRQLPIELSGRLESTPRGGGECEEEEEGDDDEENVVTAAGHSSRAKRRHKEDSGRSARSFSSSSATSTLSSTIASSSSSSNMDASATSLMSSSATISSSDDGGAGAGSESGAHHRPSRHHQRRGESGSTGASSSLDRVSDEPYQAQRSHSRQERRRRLTSDTLDVDGRSSSPASSCWCVFRRRRWRAGLTCLMRGLVSRVLRPLQTWWTGWRIIVMYHPIQWLLLLLILVKCIECILKAANSSMMAGLQLAVPSMSVSLLIASLSFFVTSSSLLIPIEMLISMGWGLAFTSPIPKNQTVLVCTTTLVMVVIYSLCTTCEGTDFDMSLTVNPFARARVGSWCNTINYIRVTAELLCRLHNVIRMFALTRWLSGTVLPADVAATRRQRKMRLRQLQQQEQKQQQRDTEVGRPGGDVLISTPFSKSMRRRYPPQSPATTSTSAPRPSISLSPALVLLSPPPRRGYPHGRLSAMDVYLRYRGMWMPFAILLVWPVLLLIFAFTFYQPEDYYMVVTLREFQVFYFLSFIILFLRTSSPVYC